MKHANTGAKKRAREEAARNPAPNQPAPVSSPKTTFVPGAVGRFENPDDVEILLRLQKQKREQQSEVVKLPPPDRSNHVGGILELDNIFTAWFDVTPQRALDWLQYNTCNRAVNKGKVQSFARQILNGDYVLTHQGAAFNDADELVDGQHFLKAIIMTGKTVRRMVTFGLPKRPAGKNFSTMDVIDSGGRSVSDQLKIGHGIKDSSTVRTVCGAIANICYGNRTRNLSVGQILQVYTAFKPSVDYIIANRSKLHGLKQAGLLAAFSFAHSAFYGENGKVGPTAVAIEKLLIQLNTGHELADQKTYEARKASGKDNRPLEHLRYFLTSDEAILIGKAMNRSISQVVLQVIYAELHKVRTTQLEQSEVGLNWFTAKQKDRVSQISNLFKLPTQSK